MVVQNKNHLEMKRNTKNDEFEEFDEETVN